MNKKIFFIIIVLIGSILTIISFKNSKTEIPNESPRFRNISKINFFLGKFKPSEMVRIQPKTSGIIDEVFVAIGDKVSVNDKIARLRIIPIPEVIESTKSALQIAAVNLEQTEVDHRRNTDLFSKDVIAKIELEKTQLALDVATIAHRNAQNSFNIAKKGFSKNASESPNIIRATINGEVLNVLVKKGENVTERNTFNDGSTVAILVNSASYKFEFEITEIDIACVSKGDVFGIAIKALGNKVVQAKIAELKPLIKSDNSFYYLASAVVTDPINNLKPGFTGLAEFVLQKREATLSIKEKNIIYKSRKSYVELIAKDDSISEIEITVGISDGIYTEVLSGIKKSDRIKIQ